MRIARVTAGLTMLPVGVALLVLPGPGIPFVIGGLALLEGELGWAGPARARIRTFTRAVSQRTPFIRRTRQRNSSG